MLCLEFLELVKHIEEKERHLRVLALYPLPSQPLAAAAVAFPPFVSSDGWIPLRQQLATCFGDSGETRAAAAVLRAAVTALAAIAVAKLNVDVAAFASLLTWQKRLSEAYNQCILAGVAPVKEEEPLQVTASAAQEEGAKPNDDLRASFPPTAQDEITVSDGEHAPDSPFAPEPTRNASAGPSSSRRSLPHAPGTSPEMSEAQATPAAVGRALRSRRSLAPVPPPKLLANSSPTGRGKSRKKLLPLESDGDGDFKEESDSSSDSEDDSPARKKHKPAVEENLLRVLPPRPPPAPVPPCPRNKPFDANIFAPSSFSDLQRPSAADVKALQSEALFKRADFGGALIKAMSRRSDRGEDLLLRVIPNHTFNVFPGKNPGDPWIFPGGCEYVEELQDLDLVPVIRSVDKKDKNGGKWQWYGGCRIRYQGFSEPGEFRKALAMYPQEAQAILQAFRAYAKKEVCERRKWNQKGPGLRDEYWTAVDDLADWMQAAKAAGVEVSGGRPKGSKKADKEARADYDRALDAATNMIGREMPEVPKVPHPPCLLSWWGFDRWQLKGEELDSALIEWLDGSSKVRWQVYEWAGLHRAVKGKAPDFELETWRAARAARED